MLSIDRILWPTDFSDGAEKAFPYAAVLADWHEAELHCLNVNETAPDVPAGVTDQFPLASDTLASYMSAESASSPPLEVEQLRLHQTQVNSSSPAEAILSHAEKDEIDLIVAGTHGRRGMHRMFIRSVTEEVLRRASCAVPTVRADRDLPAAWNVGHIPVPVDVSESAEKAVRYAKELALAYGAHLTLLHAIEESAYPSSYDMESIDFPDEEVIPRVEDSLNEMARDLIGAEHGGAIRWPGPPGLSFWSTRTSTTRSASSCPLMGVPASSDSCWEAWPNTGSGEQRRRCSLSNRLEIYSCRRSV